MAAKVDKHDSDEDWSSSDEDEIKGPPPVMTIEKSADLNAMKTAFLNAAEKSPAPENKTAEIQGLGAEGLSKAKDVFAANKQSANQQQQPERKNIEIPRSEAEKKLVQKTFFEAPEKDEPKDCTVCGKVVYPVEKINVEKRIFHKNCFNCCKCQKKLTAQNYSTHEGNLYCKLHMLEIRRPEVVKAFQRGELSEADLDNELVEEGDYVLVSKPKAHDPSVVVSSLKSADDLENVGSLKDKKSEWAKSAEQSAVKPEASNIDAQLIEQGGVKSKLTKFVEGEAGKEQKSDEEDETDQNRDPNIIKSSKKKEKINVEVGAKSIKGKWEAGTMERAQGDLEDRTHELEEIKKSVSVKDKSKDLTFAAEVEEAARRKSTLGEDIGDTSFSSAAKERFLKGDAFQDTNPVEKLNVAEQVKFAELSNVKERFEKQPLDEKPMEKTIVDARCAELGGIKAAFESAAKKGSVVEDDAALAARKKELLEAEFKQFEEARKVSRETQQEAFGDTGQEPKYLEVAGLNPAELSSLKQKFEAGASAFQQPRDSAASATKTLEQSKWAKESGPKPEPINKRTRGPDDDQAGGDDFEVRNLLNKFKNIEQGKVDEPKGPKPKRQITPPLDGSDAYKPEFKPELLQEKEITPSVTAEELAAIKVEAKNLKAKFESVAAEKKIDPEAEEKRKYLEEEFKKLKELKEQQEKEEAQMEPAGQQPDADEKAADLAAAAEHGQKSRAKWEKIERKEQKKAQKAAQAARRSVQGAKEI